MPKEAKTVPFYENGKIIATVTVEFTENGKKLVPSPGFKLYPMDIHDVEVSERELDPDLIMNWLIGDVRRRSYMVPVRSELYSELMIMEWKEAADNTLQRRCRIPDGNGLTKVCRRRSCCNCPHTNEDHATSVPMSLDALMEDSNYEASTGDITSEMAMSRIEEEEFLAYLAHHDPKFVTVYKKLKVGYSTADIASMLNVTDRMIRNYRKEIKKLREQFEEQ
jgi:hypothetical protein